MFTGIIEATASVLERSETGLVLARPALFDDLVTGCSICVTGACLTVTAFDDHFVAFDVMQETWERTKLESLKKGDLVNLERAMRLGDRLDGHIVQGHVDAVGEVVEIGVVRTKNSKIPRSKTPNKVQISKFKDPKNVRMLIRYPEELRGLIVEKGSITVDGVSLTVASVDTDQFSVALIPTTLRETTLVTLQKGDPVNLEADVLGRYVQSIVTPRPREG